MDQSDILLKLIFFFVELENVFGDQFFESDPIYTSTFFYQYYWRSRVEIDAFDFSHVESLFLEIVFNICDLLYGDQRVVGDPSSFKKNFRDLMNLVKTDFSNPG